MTELIRTQVSIYGEEYSLRGSLPEEIVEALAKHVDSRMRSIAAGSPGVSGSRIAVLAALNMAEELFQLQSEHEELIEAMQEQWRSRKNTNQVK